jgi:perosamine synthetase
MIPISKVSLSEEIENEVLEVLRSGAIAQGPKVAELEVGFSQLCGVEHVVAVNNGTTALIAALEVLDLKRGDEVITSPFTFVATLNAILQTGATARFVDIREDDFNIDTGLIEERVSARTKVILPVHLYGQMAEMSTIEELATRYGLSIVEDAAQAHGASYKSRPAGSWGIGCFSLYATKNLTSAEGGLISTSNATIADRLRVLRNQGMRTRYQYEVAGNNYRLTDLQAAVCVPQLRHYQQIVEKRKENARLLSEGLADIEWLSLPRELPNRNHVWHQYTVLLGKDCPVDRDQVIENLTERGVGAGIYYPKLVHDYECYQNNPRIKMDETPVAKSVTERCLSLPIHQHLSSSDIEKIVLAVRGICQ